MINVLQQNFIVMLILHKALALSLSHWAGLSVGGCTVPVAMAASAIYIAALPAVRMTLPDANPTYYLTASLAVTLLFQLLWGVPLYDPMSRFIANERNLTPCN